VTILVAFLQIFLLQALLGFRNSCNFKLLHLASKLRLSQEKMSPLEENLFMKLIDDIEGSDGLAEEDKDFLKSLEKMAEEIESEVKVLIKEDPAPR
jgi:hypothetical protein